MEYRPGFVFQTPTIAEPPKFELESYIANYTGRTRLSRLYFIGTRSKFLSTEALRLAAKEAKNGRDVDAYKSVIEALCRVTEDDVKPAVDWQWIEKTTRENELETERLETELKGYKNNLIKESIRMGYEELAQHYYKIGDLENSLRSYSRLREHCTTSSHVLSRLINSIIVVVDQSYSDTRARLCELSRASEAIKDADALSKAKLQAATGLYSLIAKDYSKAATSFLTIDPILGNNFSEVLTINDIAIYGTLCALATMDRNDLRELILNNPSFQKIIEEEPHLRQAVKFFCASKFQSFFQILESYKVDYLLDIHLSKHVSSLYQMIRTKAMQQYIIPFSVVKLDSLRTALYGSNDTDESTKVALIRELSKLIASGTLDARLDLEKDTLLVGHEWPDKSTVKKDVLRNAQDFINQAHLELVHLNIVYANAEITTGGKAAPAKTSKKRAMQY